MPELIEHMYCSQQIVIPPKFPYILKRYSKAAIKTQPYDLLRWSYEYFNALAQHRPPPVKLRLEYPVYCTLGGLTRGCLKVLAQQSEVNEQAAHLMVSDKRLSLTSAISKDLQILLRFSARNDIGTKQTSVFKKQLWIILSGMEVLPLPALKAAWQGFCLDYEELKRIMCLCEVYMREDSVPFLNFVAVASGLLTKTLTHTMILVCETLTKEPDGGSASIPVEHFLTMYKFLAHMDASKDINYYNGHREGQTPPPEPESAESETAKSTETLFEQTSTDDFWQDDDLKKLMLIDDKVARTARISVKLNMPIIGKIERSPSVERAEQLEREKYLREREERPQPDEEVDEKLREMSSSKMNQEATDKDNQKSKDVDMKQEKKKDGVIIIVHDENGVEIPYEIYGEPKIEITAEEEELKNKGGDDDLREEVADAVPTLEDQSINMTNYVDECLKEREERRVDLTRTFDEIAAIVDKFQTASYDLGMVAGRQMSTTSGEFVVSHLEHELMDKVNEQISILPDPELQKKKAKPEEVAMIRDVLESYLDENIDVIVPEEEETEEEEKPLPKITVVYAAPGIGPSVDEDIIKEFEEYALEVSKEQSGLFMPRNIRHFLCPPLEKCIEYVPEKEVKKEEVPIGGVITD